MWSEDYDNRLEKLLRHIENVRNNCEILGKKLIEQGKEQEGLTLIQHGLMHDSSKFGLFEFEHLTGECKDPQAFDLAIKHHHALNPHHSEHWGHISKMPDVYLAEFVCDVKARASEFGSSLLDWLEEEATKKYDFKKGDETWNRIMTFVDMVCDKPFKNAKD